MTKCLKILLGIVILAVLAFSIIWAASFAFRLIFSFQGFNLRQAFTQGFHLTDQVRSQPFDIFHYMSHYAATYPKQIKGAWMMAVGGHALVIGTILYIIFGRRQPNLYGNARFATLREIKKAKLLVPSQDVRKGGLWAGKRIIFAFLVHFLPSSLLRPDPAKASVLSCQSRSLTPTVSLPSTPSRNSLNRPGLCAPTTVTKCISLTHFRLKAGLHAGIRAAISIVIPSCASTTSTLLPSA